MYKEYIKSPINYVGNKYRLLKQIVPLFPKDIHTFVDVFGGSGTVLFNVEAENYVYNDINNYVSEIVDGIISNTYEEIVDKIEAIIKQYDLSMVNKEGFEKLREDYNKGKRDWVTLYTLMCHSFNHQFRFNSNHEYNSSFGKNRSYFSDRQRQDLLKVKDRLKGKEDRVQVGAGSIFDIDFKVYTKEDFLYFDPPYFNSVGNYNDGKRGFDGWTKEHEEKLWKLLNELNDKGIRWALSNNLKYDNDILKSNLDRYTVHTLKGDYLNCSYHKKDRETKDVEILVTNIKG